MARSPTKLNIFCLDPEIPDLPAGQLAKLHALKDAIAGAYLDCTVGDNAVPPQIVVPLIAVHAASENLSLFGKADATTVQVAQALDYAAKANAKLHVPYKTPKNKKAPVK
jgi:hypothetical protein